MTEIKIDAVKAVELIEAAVAERGGDYIYPNIAGVGCQYVLYADGGWDGKTKHTERPDNGPGCIVGLALHKAGIMTMGELKEWDSKEDQRANVVMAGDPRFTEGAARVFRKAQYVQDSYRPWSEALHAAKDALIDIKDRDLAL